MNNFWPVAVSLMRNEQMPKIIDHIAYIMNNLFIDVNQTVTYNFTMPEDRIDDLSVDEGAAKIIDLKQQGLIISDKIHEKARKAELDGFHDRAQELSRRSRVVGKNADEILTRRTS